jgi:hypothetical protein
MLIPVLRFGGKNVPAMQWTVDPRALAFPESILVERWIYQPWVFLP